MKIVEGVSIMVVSWQIVMNLILELVDDAVNMVFDEFNFILPQLLV